MADEPQTTSAAAPSDSSGSSGEPPRRSLWRRYLDIPLIWKLAVALVLGVVAGLAVGEPITVIEPLGDIFLRLLSMLVMPLILLTLVSGVASVSPTTLGRIGGKAFIYYLVTTAFAMTAGIGLALLISPGAGLTLDGTEEVEEQSAPPLSQVLTEIVPENIFSALADGRVLAVMFFALVAGVALAFLQDSEEERLASLAADLRRFVDGGIGVQVVVYAVILLLFRAPIGRFFRAAKEPMLTGFVTRSSSGTLPVTSQAAEKLGVGKGVYSFTLPLGATINMDGTAIYVGAATVFVADVTGAQLTVAQLATVAAVGVLASVGTAGVPGAGLIMLTMAVTSAGLPMGPVALVAGIDAILDMGRTVCNVTGDLTGTRVIAKTEKGMLAEDAGRCRPESDRKQEREPARARIR